MTFRVLLGLASLATVGVALWLFWVSALVLPARDPGHILTWRIVAASILVYSGLSWAYLFLGRRIALLRWLLLLISVAAIGAGVYGIFTMARQADVGGHFEGYVVLMGAILAGHGLCAVACTVLTGRIADRLRIE